MEAHEPPSCPRCPGRPALTRGDPSVGDLPCPQCQGRFLSPEDAERVLQGLLRLSTEVIHELARHFAGERLRCPACAARMNPLTIRSVPVDVCMTCGGLWLDVGELGRLTAGVMTETAAQPAAASPPVSVSAPAPHRELAPLPEGGLHTRRWLALADPGGGLRLQQQGAHRRSSAWGWGCLAAVLTLAPVVPGLLLPFTLTHLVAQTAALWAAYVGLRRRTLVARPGVVEVNTELAGRCFSRITRDGQLHLLHRRRTADGGTVGGEDEWSLQLAGEPLPLLGGFRPVTILATDEAEGRALGDRLSAVTGWPLQEIHVTG